MGHTLIVSWDKREFQQIDRQIKCLSQYHYNKIPYGRKCDRETSDQILPYHMTVFHWGKEEDYKYLEKMNNLTFHPFSVFVNRAMMIPDAEGSQLLMLSVELGKDYSFFRDSLNASELYSPPFPHITVAASKKPHEIDLLYRQICYNVTFPFTIYVSRLELYHIWRPVRLVRQWFPDEKSAALDHEQE